MRTRTTPWLLVGLLALVGCSDAGFADYGGDTDADGWGAADDDTDFDTQPPEQEDDDFLALPPSQTDVYVFVANPNRNTVTRIDVFSLDVKTVEVGADPRLVRVTPDYDYAVVFNRGGDSVSIVDSTTLEVWTTPVRDNYNAMRMSHDGAWVGLFHSQAAEQPDDPPPDGLQSFNEVSFVSVPDGVHHPMAVSFNPRDIQFSEDGTLAVVVADEALWLVDLTQEVLVPQRVAVGSELDPPAAEEVVLSPSGQYAFVRQFGADDLLVVDLGTGGLDRLPVGAGPTDLDLTPDGASAVVVSRTSGQVWVYTADQPQLPPRVLDLPEPLSAGSVIFDPYGDQAVLFTTATNTTAYAIWDMQTDDVVVHDLVKPVRAMAVTPTGESLLVLHSEAVAPDTVPGSVWDTPWAMSLVSLDPTNYRENPIKLPAEPMGFANAGDGLNGYFIMDGVTSLVEIDYVTLLYTEIRLKSVPVFVGVLPDLDDEDGMRPPAWASQEHPLGRISFYHPPGSENGPGDGERGRLETITGFELNSRIEE